MVVPRRFLETRLAALTGATVRVGRLLASPTAGSIEVLDTSITIGGQPSPTMRLPRVKAAVSLTRALDRTLSLKSVAIERPILWLVQRSDGTLTLPVVPSWPGVRNVTGARRGWRVEVGRVLVVDGEVRFHSEWPPAAGYELMFGGALAEFVRSDDGFEFTLIMRADSAGGRPLAGVEVKGMGRITPPTNPPRTGEGATPGDAACRLRSPSGARWRLACDARPSPPARSIWNYAAMSAWRTWPPCCPRSRPLLPVWGAPAVRSVLKPPGVSRR